MEPFPSGYGPTFAMPLTSLVATEQLSKLSTARAPLHISAFCQLPHPTGFTMTGDS